MRFLFLLIFASAFFFSFSFLKNNKQANGGIGMFKDPLSMWSKWSLTDGRNSSPLHAAAALGDAELVGVILNLAAGLPVPRMEDDDEFDDDDDDDDLARSDSDEDLSASDDDGDESRGGGSKVEEKQLSTSRSRRSAVEAAPIPSAAAATSRNSDRRTLSSASERRRSAFTFAAAVLVDPFEQLRYSYEDMGMGDSSSPSISPRKLAYTDEDSSASSSHLSSSSSPSSSSSSSSSSSLLLYATFLGQVLSAVDLDGRTALHVAARHGHGQIVQQILQAASAEHLYDLTLERAEPPWLAAQQRATSGLVGVAASAGDSGGGSSGASASSSIGPPSPLPSRQPQTNQPFRVAARASAELTNGATGLALARLRSLRGLLASSQVADLLDCRGNTALHLAKSPACVAALCARGGDPTLANQSGASPLHAAVRRGDPTVVAALLSGGADPGQRERHRGGKQWTPLHLAVASPSCALLTAAFFSGPNFSPAETAATIAVQGAPAPSPDLSVELRAALAKADLDGNTALHLCARFGGAPALSRKPMSLLEAAQSARKSGGLDSQADDDNAAALTPGNSLQARGASVVAALTLLLKHGGDANAENKRGQRPLHLLLANRFLAVERDEWLAGANFLTSTDSVFDTSGGDSSNSSDGSGGVSGSSPDDSLIVAVLTASSRASFDDALPAMHTCAKLLLQGGDDIDHDDVMMAYRGADPSAVDALGCVALHAAARAKDAPLCALLVAHGAQLNHAQLRTQAAKAEAKYASEPERFPGLAGAAGSMRSKSGKGGGTDGEGSSGGASSGSSSSSSNSSSSKELSSSSGKHKKEKLRTMSVVLEATNEEDGDDDDDDEGEAAGKTKKKKGHFSDDDDEDDDEDDDARSEDLEVDNNAAEGGKKLPEGGEEAVDFLALGDEDEALSPLAGVSFRPRVFLYDLVPDRAFLWSVLRALRAPPLQVPDSACADCMGCRKAFNDLRWRHHCRFCARLLCAACVNFKAPAAAFPPAYLEGHSSAVVTAHRAGSKGRSASSVASVPLPSGLKRIAPGSTKNAVCEDCHAVLTSPIFAK